MDLSIIIPTCNRNQKVNECLQAIVHNDAEIIVVDDGSKTAVSVPSAVRLIRHNKNRGRAAALNTGLRAASHDLVLLVDDDIYAAPDMVVRLVDEFAVWNNPKLAIVGRLLWDPDVRITATMRWLEESGPFHDTSGDRSGILSNLTTGNTILWRPFVLEHGGFDENFKRGGLEDIELGLRLKKQGLEVRLLSSAVGYHSKVMGVHDLVNRELEEGAAAVYLHSKFPEFIPQVADIENLLRNAEREEEVAEAVEELSLMELSEPDQVSTEAAELFMLVYRHYFLRGIVDGLAEVGTARVARRSSATLALYNQASELESMRELSEARRLFRLVRERQDAEYWAGAEYHLGVIEIALGNIDGAVAHFAGCLAINPRHRKARQALTKAAKSQAVSSASSR